MSVRCEGDVVRLEGDCRVEDAEALAAALAGRPGRTVDLSGAQRLHTAVLQALLALGADIAGEPRDAFQRRWLAQALQRPSPRRPDHAMTKPPTKVS